VSGDDQGKTFGVEQQSVSTIETLTLGEHRRRSVGHSVPSNPMLMNFSSSSSSNSNNNTSTDKIKQTKKDKINHEKNLKKKQKKNDYKKENETKRKKKERKICISYSMQNLLMFLFVFRWSCEYRSAHVPLGRTWRSNQSSWSWLRSRRVMIAIPRVF